MVIPSRPILMNDPINPTHYKDGAVECIEALEACSSDEGFRAHLKLTAIAYLWRYEKKNGVEDVKKAKWYIERLIAHLEDLEAAALECKDGFCPMPGVRYDTPIQGASGEDHIFFKPA